MMKSEFIERTGFEPTAEEYREIEAEYMGCDIDKDQFCKQWKKDGGITRLMRTRARRIEELEDETAVLNAELKSEEEYSNKMGSKLGEKRMEICKLKDELDKADARIEELEAQIAQYEAFKQAMAMMKVALGA